MKRIFISLLFTLLVYTSFSQTYVFKMQPEGSVFWGYSDVNGNIIIEPQYRSCNDFSTEGIAAIYYEGDQKYEFINLENEFLDITKEGLIVHSGYGGGIKGFNSGMACYKLGRHWGAMNALGEIVFQPKYKKISVFSDGYATAHLNGKFYVLDNRGNETPVATEDIKDLKKFCNAYAPYRNKKGLWGYVNTKAEIAIQAQFRGVGYFESDLAWARTKYGDVGFINTEGEWVIQPRFSEVKNFDASTGLAKVKVNEVWGFLDKQGNVYYQDVADKFYDFSEGLLRAVVDGMVGYLDTQFNWVIQPQFNNARDFRNGYAAVKVGDGWGIIDKTGKIVINPIYKGIKDVVKINK